MSPAKWCMSCLPREDQDEEGEHCPVQLYSNWFYWTECTGHIYNSWWWDITQATPHISENFKDLKIFHKSLEFFLESERTLFIKCNVTILIKIQNMHYNISNSNLLIWKKRKYEHVIWNEKYNVIRSEYDSIWCVQCSLHKWE